jgi:hypothetical protein
MQSKVHHHHLNLDGYVRVPQIYFHHTISHAALASRARKKKNDKVQNLTHASYLNFHNPSLRSNNELNLASKSPRKTSSTHSISSGKKVRGTLGLITTTQNMLSHYMYFASPLGKVHHRIRLVSRNRYLCLFYFWLEVSLQRSSARRSMSS